MCHSVLTIDGVLLTGPGHGRGFAIVRDPSTEVSQYHRNPFSVMISTSSTPRRWDCSPRVAVDIGFWVTCRVPHHARNMETGGSTPIAEWPTYLQ